MTSKRMLSRASFPSNDQPRLGIARIPAILVTRLEMRAMRSPEYFRVRAEEARTLAGEMRAESNQATLLKIAEQYDQLQSMAEREKARAAKAASE
jgi:hypothetical protein